VVHIEVPSWAAARSIPLLVAHFLEQIARKAASAKFTRRKRWSYWRRPSGPATWPAVQRRAAKRGVVAWPISSAELVQQSLGGNPTRLPSFDEARDEFTRNYLSQILPDYDGNVSQAARLAKRNRTDFYKLLSRHQLLPDDFKKA